MYNENEKAVVWIASNTNLTNKKQNLLLKMFNNPKELWNKFNEVKQDVIEIVGKDDFLKLEFSKDEKFINSYIKNCLEQNIKIVTCVSSDYSELLREIDSPPLVLYCKGDTKLLNSKCLAVVGSRRSTRYGNEVTYMLTSPIAKSGITIVSGLADGIDAQAHRATLDAGGKTIAVLGSGLNEIYPLSNVGLYREIEKTGLIVSEYKPNEKPQTYYFPARNRIIAGLSQAVLITEAAEKSGSMHTKNYALDFNRNLFVVPGRITDKNSLGCNKIIKNLQSTMVIDEKEILDFYGVSGSSIEINKHIQLDLNDEILLSLFESDEELHYEEILIKSNLEPKTVNTTLTRLELKGLIKKQSGNYYCKKLSF